MEVTCTNLVLVRKRGGREGDSWSDWRRLFHMKGGGNREGGGAFRATLIPLKVEI